MKIHRLYLFKLCFVILSVIAFTGSKGFTQNKFTISGYITDNQTGEKLIGATVFNPLTFEGTSSNVYGFYSLTIPEGNVEVSFSYVGYQTKLIQIDLVEDITMNVSMKTSNVLESIDIEAARYSKINKDIQMSMNEISVEQVKSLPVFMGEKDILKSIQLLPGVQSGSEGTSGIYVRGGGPDQNLILLDGVPIYNAFHLFGFFSVFNPDAINHIKLYKGGFPARFGGRLSSVIDIRMKDGNMNEFHGEGSIGLISSKLSLEGPILKDKTSFFLSARRTYLDLLIKPFVPQDEYFPYYFFYDLNTKINHKFSDKSRLYFSLYNGLDKFGIKYEDSYSDYDYSYNDKYENSIDWGNTISALRWNYIINPKLFSNTTFTYSRYKYNIESFYKSSVEENNIVERYEYLSRFTSGINDWSGKIDFDYIPTPDHYMRFGAGNIIHKFTPGVNQYKSDYNTEVLDTVFGSQNQVANEAYLYCEDEYKVTDLLKINAGLHATGFNVNGKNYFSLQPRIAGRFILTENSSIKASYSRMVQYLHLLTNPSMGLPTDLWVPTTDRIGPETSNITAVGFAYSLPYDLDLSIEAYYKTMDGLIEYGDGISFFGSDQDWQNKVETGKGWSYGGEFLLEKKLGKTTGWIGYTLSWTNRQFDNISQGKVYPYRYDRRHDIGIALTHEFSEKFDVGMVWVYGTGNSFSLGLDRYQDYDNQYYYGSPINQWYSEIEHVEKRNNYRMPSYHRMDLSLNYHKKHKLWESTWSISIYNLYNRKNPFFLYVDYNDNGEKGLTQVSLFPIIPTLTLGFKF